LHGRTLPCERTTNDDGKTLDDSSCQACQQKQPYRTHVYVSCFESKSHDHFIFECTAFAGKAFAEYIASVGTLRGCAFQATRPKNTPNGKVVILTATANLSRIPLPNSPDVAKALAVIWRLPRVAFDTIVTPFAHPRLSPDPSLLATMRNQPDNAADPPSIAEILSGNGNGSAHHF
jgi:hypothetical protein